MAKQNFGGVYANMEFKPYVWTEYPKHIPTGPYGKYELANNKTEEEKILARLQQEQDDAPAENIKYVPDPVKEILISRAAELGLPINRQWSKAKLERLVQEAEADVDNLPVEEQEAKASDDKDLLIAQAKALGIPANKLWGIPRLKSSIAEFNKSNEA